MIVQNNFHNLGGFKSRKQTITVQAIQKFINNYLMID